MTDIVERLRDLARFRPIVERLRDLARFRPVDVTKDDCLEAADEIERLREGLEQIVRWSEAYPLDIWPEPDFQKAHEVLTANNMTLDAISASCMRRVVEGVGNIAALALKEKAGD